MRAFAERLRQIQVERGLSQLQLSQLAGISQGAVSDYLNDKKSPSIETASAIAKALDVSVGWLCGEDTIDILKRGRIAYNKIVPLLNELVKDELFSFKVSLCEESKMVWFGIEDETLYRYFEATKKARELYRDEVIDKDMFDAIAEKQIKIICGDDYLDI